MFKKKQLVIVLSSAVCFMYAPFLHRVVNYYILPKW